MNLNTDMAGYYAKRAASYEEIYAKPERQRDLSQVHEWLRATLAGHRVLEVACGTGYWTAAAAMSAETIYATDINPTVIALADLKQLPSEKVTFALADAFTVEAVQSFTACFAAFWWSHVLRQEQAGFMKQLRQQLGKDALVALIDNVYVEGSSTSIARTDLQGNTFQIRMLPDGERYEILKNFPSDSSLRKRLAPYLKEIRILRLEHYWMLSGRLK